MWYAKKTLKDGTVEEREVAESVAKNPHLQSGGYGFEFYEKTDAKEEKPKKLAKAKTTDENGTEKTTD